MKRKLVFLGLILALIALPIAACAKKAPAPAPAPAPATAPAPAPAPKPDPIVLTAVQSGPIGGPQFWAWAWYVDEIEKRSNGELKIDVIGGPDAIGTAEQAVAVSEGSVDMGCIWVNRLADLYKPAEMWPQRQLSTAVLRDNGTYGILQREFSKAGVYWIGAASDTVQSYITMFLNPKVEKPEDLAGVKMATGPFATRIMKTWDMVGVMVPPVERYTAVERGVADGTIVGFYYGAEIGVWDVADYWLDNRTGSSSESLVVNMDKWNSLPPHLQALMIGLQEELDGGVSQEFTKKAQDESKKAYLDNGMAPITFSGADAKRYTEKIAQVTRDFFLNAYPADGRELIELLGL